MRVEDTEQTLLFVDMLGTSQLTEEFPIRLVDSGPDEAGFYQTVSDGRPQPVRPLYARSRCCGSRMSVLWLRAGDAVFRLCIFGIRQPPTDGYDGHNADERLHSEQGSRSHGRRK